MARFYGSIQGDRGEATRLARSPSGLRASAQTWNGSVVTTVYGKDGEDYVRIAVSGGSSAYGDHILYDGPMKALVGGGILALVRAGWGRLPARERARMRKQAAKELFLEIAA
jgi:hypothetical protein